MTLEKPCPFSQSPIAFYAILLYNKDVITSLQVNQVTQHDA